MVKNNNHNTQQTLPNILSNTTEILGGCPVIFEKMHGKYIAIGYSELQQYVNEFTEGLIGLGMKPSDNIGILSENRSEWVIADFAIMQGQGVTVPFYHTLAPKQIEYIINDGDVKFLIVENKMQADKVIKAKKKAKGLEKIILRL